MLVTPASRALRWSILQHLGLQVAGQNRSLGADPLRQADAVVAGAGTDVRHGRASGILRASSMASGCSSSIACLAKQPVDALPTT